MVAVPPAEWSPLHAVVTAWPSHPLLWGAELGPARDEVAALVRQLSATVPVHVLAHGAEPAATAAEALGDAATVHDRPFGDIWFRDTGPLFVARDRAVAFRQNGWGGKYLLPHDEAVAPAIADLMEARLDRQDAVLEGGAIEGDGQGLLLTTEQCLLNPNRNPGWTRQTAERVLRAALGTRRVIWLGEGLMNDHTDGHVDNLARFVAPGSVALPEPADDDPNAPVFADARARLAAANMLVHAVPSVGRLEADGEPVPASHMNWVVANGQVIVPLYGGPSDGPAVDALARLFPRHRVTGLPSNAILSGGGSFHCITQQVPR
jgi:agmatine deiminase